MLDSTVDTFTWSESWEIDHDAKTVKKLGTNLEQRNRQMLESLIAEKERGSFRILKAWMDEEIPVYGPKKELVISVQKAAAPLFGIITYGVQLLAYQNNAVNNDIGIWIARRAKTKRTYPGMMDSTVGGSLRTGETPFECLVRESAEEAWFPNALVKARAVACGTVNYVGQTDEKGGGELGLFTPEVQYTYEMELPKDMTPRPGDNEAEEITLLSVEQIRDALAKGDFTPANGCIVLDFFIRHGT